MAKKADEAEPDHSLCILLTPPNSANNRPAGQGHSIAAEAKPRRLKLGIDVHWSQYTVVAQFDGASPRPAQRFTPQAFLAWVATKLQDAEGSKRNTVQARDVMS